MSKHYHDPRLDESAQFHISLLPATKFLTFGVLGDGSCYLHSVFTSLYGDQYRSLSEKARTKYVVDYREKLADSFSFNDYIASDVSDLYYGQELADNLHKIWRDKTFSSLFPDYESAYTNLRLQHPPLVITKEFLEKFPREYRDIIRSLTEKSIEASYYKFNKLLKNPKHWVDQDLLLIINQDSYTPQKLSNYNVLYISTAGDLVGLPRETCDEMLYNGKPYILTHYTSNHYEPIMRIEEDRLTSIFPNDDSQIRRLLRAGIS